MGRLAFDDPAWLLIALAALPLIWIGWRRFRSMSHARRLVSISLRAVLATVLAALLAGASWVGQVDRASVIVVADLSESARTFGAVSAQSDTGEPSLRSAEQRVRALFAALAEARGPDDTVGVVVFGGRPLASVLPTRGDLAQSTLELDVGDGSDLDRAIRFAGALAPADAATRLVVVSDGAETSGDALAAARAVSAGGAVASGVRVDTAALSYRVEREAAVEAVDLPPRAPSESRVTARVTLRASAAMRGELRLLRDGQPIPLSTGAMAQPVTLSEGLSTVLLDVDLPPGRVHRFEAVFEPEPGAGDGIASNNRASAFTLAPGAGAALIIDSAATEGVAGGVLAEALRAADLRVDILPPSAMPPDLLGLEAYDLIVLRNVPADALPEAGADRLAAFVRDLGGGLVMVGGTESFGAGGWKGSAIEPILPVALDLPERLVAPEAAIVFVLDSSGSMNNSVLGSARTKQQIVNEAASIAVRTMDRRDLVGVIAFDRSPRVIVPLNVNEAPDQAISAIRSIGPGGGTNIGPALRLAQQQLRGSDAKIKHVILLSDGRSMAPEGLPDLAAELQGEGVRVSAIAVGEEADLPTMRSIARSGGGAFYEVLNPSRLPRVFVKAVRIVRSPLIREGRFTPVLTRPGDELAEPISAGIPPLDGLVLSTPRNELGVRTVLATPGGDPVLAAWRAGLGQVVAFTSDADRWAEPWIDDGAFGRFWTHVARRVARPGGAAAGDLRVSTENGRVQLRFEAADAEGAPLDGLDVPAIVYAPDGTPVETRLTPVAPGVYEGSAPASSDGVHVAILKPVADGVALAPVLGGASVRRSEELRRLESDDALMRRLAEATGGAVIDLDRPDARALFDRGDLPPKTAARPLWPALLIWAVVFTLLDFASRRIAWDRWFSREFGADWRAESAAVGAKRAVGAARLAKGRREAVEIEPDADRPAASAFTDADAAATARAQIDRLRAERLERLKAEARAERKGSAPVVEETRPETDSSDSGPEAEGAAGLLAAKRRARERFESNDE